MQRLLTIPCDNQAVQVVQPISQISIDVHIKNAVHGEWLAGAQTSNTGKQNIAEEGAKRARMILKGRKPGHKAVCQPVTHIKICRTAFAGEVETVLRQSGRASQIENIRYVVRRFR